MKYFVQAEGREIALEVVHNQSGTLVRHIDEGDESATDRIDFAPVMGNVDTGEGLYSLIVDGNSYQLYIQPSDDGFRVAVGHHRYDLSVLTEREWRLQKVAPRIAANTGATTINAPMPGLVKSVLVAVGDPVKRGQRLLVLEAMKMENDITAPSDGKITLVEVEAGAIVESGKRLVRIES